MDYIESFVLMAVFFDGFDTVDGSEIRQTPVRVGSLSYYIIQYTTG